MQKYTFQCIQPDGLVFKYKGFPFSTKKEAREVMKEYKSVFTPCKDWKVVEV